jgi:hypothetical protein
MQYVLRCSLVPSRDAGHKSRRFQRNCVTTKAKDGVKEGRPKQNFG